MEKTRRNPSPKSGFESSAAFKTKLQRLGAVSQHWSGEPSLMDSGSRVAGRSLRRAYQQPKCHVAKPAVAPIARKPLWNSSYDLTVTSRLPTDTTSL
jgi:hypothetical protein